MCKWVIQHLRGPMLSHRIEQPVVRASGRCPGWTLYISLFLLTSLLMSCAPFMGGQTETGQLQSQKNPPARLTYVAIGASDTFGIGTDDPRTQSWPADLTGMLGSGTRLINLGIPATLTHDALNVELPIAIDARPDLITIWLAVNDIAANVSPDSYSQDLNLLLARLHAALPHTHILVANSPDLTLLPHFQASDQQALRQQVSTYNAIIAARVAQNHAILVDLYQQWQTLADHPDYISDDGFHPNALGYMQVAEIFNKTLREQGI